MDPYSRQAFLALERLDKEGRWTVTPEVLLSKGKNTPLIGTDAWVARRGACGPRRSVSGPARDHPGPEPQARSKNPRTTSTTRSCWASVSSGYSGSDRHSSAQASVTGRSPRA